MKGEGHIVMPECGSLFFSSPAVNQTYVTPQGVGHTQTLFMLDTHSFGDFVRSQLFNQGATTPTRPWVLSVNAKNILKMNQAKWVKPLDYSCQILFGISHMGQKIIFGITERLTDVLIFIFSQLTVGII